MFDMKKVNQLDLPEEDIMMRIIILYQKYLNNYGRVPNRCHANLMCKEFYGMEVIFNEFEISVCRVMKDNEIMTYEESGGI